MMLIDDGINPKNIYTIYNSLAYSKQILIRKQLLPSNILTNHFQNNNPTIVFIGRLTRVKRLNVLLEAVNYLRKKKHFFNILLIGDGEERQKLEDYVVDNGMNDMVWFYGECFDETANAELVFNSDICVSPGNVGLTAMHAMMFGTPVITHDNLAYQMPEFESIHENMTGAFFKENDMEDLARTILRWFETHKDNRNLIRQYCYKEIDTFWNPMNQIKIINKVIEN
jgi:glycosyltransferase involved in cell wall biosynthesis